MKALVDRLSAELSSKYIQYLEAFLVDLWSEAGFIEFRCGFTLRRDHALRSFTLRGPAIAGDTDAERELLIVVIFDERGAHRQGNCRAESGSQLNGRPPSVNPAHDREVARLQRLLVELEAIPARRREAEHADDRAQTVRVLIADAMGKPTSV